MAIDEDYSCFEAILQADLRKLSTHLRSSQSSPLLMRNRQGMTLLHAAAVSNNHLVVNFLLETLIKPPNPINSIEAWVNETTTDDYTALHIAAGHGNTVRGK